MTIIRFTQLSKTVEKMKIEYLQKALQPFIFRQAAAGHHVFKKHAILIGQIEFYSNETFFKWCIGSARYT